MDKAQLITEILWLFSFVIGLAFAGIGWVMLLVPNLKFRLLVSPLVGLLLLVLATTGFYIAARLPFQSALIFGYMICVFVSVGAVSVTRSYIRLAELWRFLGVLIVVGSAYGWLSNSATVVSGGAAISFMDGTDAAGYANVADWIISGRVSSHLPALDAPIANPVNPYEQLPNIMINWEPRTGAFVWLAMVGFVRGLPGLFAYDPACGVFLTTAVLGVAAVFAQSWVSLIALIVGLTTSHWLEFSHSGYFGKMMAYPSILLLAGLFIRREEKWQALPLILLSASSGMLLNGLVTAGLIGLIGGIAIANELRIRKIIDWHRVGLLGTLAFVAIAADGLLAHPWNRGFPKPVLDHVDLAGRALDILGWSSGYKLPDPIALTLIVTMLIGPIALSVLTRFAGPAIGLLTAPPVLLVLLLPEQSPGLLQLSGFLYPSMLCGAVVASQDSRSYKKMGMSVLIVMIALTMPRAWAAIMRYSAGKNQNAYFTLGESDELAAKIGTQTTYVDVGGDPIRAVFLMVELGRRNINVQWSGQDWYYVAAGWRKWPVPDYLDKATARVRSIRRDKIAF